MRSPLASPFRGGWRNLTPMRGRGRGGANPWTPAMLPPYAWYDAELGQPKNVGYVELDGASGDNIQTPDSAALSFSNDIEVVMRVRPDDWTAAASQTLAGKYVTTGNQRTWRFYVSTAGAIGLTASANGTAVTSVSVTPTVAMTDATWVWLRMRLDLTNGANSVATLETAADAGDNVEPSSWTANGTNTGTTIAGLFDSTAPLEIGTFASGTSERLSGRVGRCIVRSGIAGTTVADFNADDCFGDGYLHTDGYVWTVGNPKIYDRSTNLRAPVVAAAGSNAPAPLPWGGTPSVYLPGTAGNAISTPHAASHDITGDIEIVANVVLSSVTVAQRIVSRGTASWAMFITSSNTLGLAFRFGGSMVYSAVALGAAIDVPLWVKITRSAATGIVSFYAASDSRVEPTSWTSLGTTTPSGSGAMDPITTSMFLGAYATTGENMAGEIRNVIVRNGIGGPSVINFDAALCSQSGCTDSVGNVWTVNRHTSGRKAVVQSPAASSARTAWLFGTDDYATFAAASLPPAAAANAFTVVAVGRTWATPVSSGRLFDSRNGAGAGVSILNFGTAAQHYASLSDGVTTVDTSAVAPTYTAGQRVAFAAVVNGTTNLVTYSNATASTAVSTASVTGSRTASLDPARIGASSAGNYNDFEFEALLTFDRALSAAEIGQLVSYYRGGS